jgi:hypothetical protein
VKCTLCELELRRSGYCVTLVSANGSLYTANLHVECLERLAGPVGRRKLDRVCLDSGWRRVCLPGVEPIA